MTPKSFNQVIALAEIFVHKIDPGQNSIILLRPSKLSKNFNIMLTFKRTIVQATRTFNLTTYMFSIFSEFTLFVRFYH